MCSPAAIAPAVGLGPAGAALLPMVMPQVQMPMQPPGVTAPPASQAAKTPDQQALRRAGTGGTAGQSTMLTGPGGVDPNLLSIGKNTLLGA